MTNEMKNETEIETEQASNENTVVQLEDILHTSLAMLERWKEDRGEFAKQISELGKSVVRFSAQLDKYKEFEKHFNQQLVLSIKSSAGEMAEIASNNFTKASLNIVNKSSCELNEAVNQTIHGLNKCIRAKNQHFWIYAASIFVMPIIVSVMIAQWVLPNSVAALNSNDMRIYENGQFFDRFWPKLSKKEQNRLQSLANAPAVSQRNSDARMNDTNTNN